MSGNKLYYPREGTSSSAIIKNAAKRADQEQRDIYIQVPRRGVFGPVKPGESLERLAEQVKTVVAMRRPGRERQEMSSQA